MSQGSKQALHDFWNRASCGEELLLNSLDADGFASQARERYRLEPYIPEFAGWQQSSGRRVLEIGLGLGADHENFARSGAILSGVDLTERAVAMTKHRLQLEGYASDLRVGDAEKLPFPDSSFDWVYSWGVIHHSPDTAKAATEILRVLKPGGEFRVMIYHKWSLVGLMLWLRYGMLQLRPWRSLADIYSHHLESPGTKAYSVAKAKELFRGAADLRAYTVLTHGDLLESAAGQRHKGLVLSIARALWPRWILRRLCARNGLFLLVKGKKG